MSIYRSRVALTNFEGAPGVNTFYWTKGIPAGQAAAEDVEAFHEELETLMTGLTSYFVDSMRWTIDPFVDEVDISTGKITGIITDPSGSRTGSATTTAISKVARFTMLNVAYLTDVWKNGRRLQGRSFIGPINQDPLGEDGRIASNSQAYVEDLFVALTSGLGPRLAVYSRPGQNGQGGSYGDVVNAICRQRPAVLKSRSV
jgi:hypothetical protein